MRIAIVKLSAMGDIVHAMVALQFIKKHHPDIEIDWIVEQGFSGVLEKNPHIGKILPVSLKAVKKSPLKLFEEIKRVRRYKRRSYDLVIDAQGLIKSALTACLLGAKRAGFSKESIREGVASLCYNKYVHIAYDANTIDRNVRVLGEPVGVEITPEMILGKEPFLFYEPDALVTQLKAEHGDYVVFVIGSTWESRNYPKEHFLTVANGLGRDVLVVWGNAEEKAKAAWIASQCKWVTVAPKLNLNGLKALIDHSVLLIGNDTGPTHMAWGLNRPSITIFGPTPTSRVYETPINKVVKSPSKVDPFKLNKEDYSIREIDPQEIVKMAKRLLDD